MYVFRGNWGHMGKTPWIGSYGPDQPLAENVTERCAGATTDTAVSSSVRPVEPALKQTRVTVTCHEDSLRFTRCHQASTATSCLLSPHSSLSPRQVPLAERTDQTLPSPVAFSPPPNVVGLAQPGPPVDPEAARRLAMLAGMVYVPCRSGWGPRCLRTACVMTDPAATLERTGVTTVSGPACEFPNNMHGGPRFSFTKSDFPNEGKQYMKIRRFTRTLVMLSVTVFAASAWSSAPLVGEKMLVEGGDCLNDEILAWQRLRAERRVAVSLDDGAPVVCQGTSCGWGCTCAVLPDDSAPVVCRDGAARSISSPAQASSARPPMMGFLSLPPPRSWSPDSR